MVDRSHNDESLIDLLEARDIHINDYEPDEALKSWLKQNLSTETLLTKEERVFAQRTRLAPIGATQTRNVISDEAFETAIASLHASISKIDQQCAVLEDHKKALAALRHSELASSGAPALNAQALVKEKAELDLDIETMVATARNDLQVQHQKVGNVITSTNNQASRAFEKDDRTLDSLQKLTSRLHGDVNHDIKLDTLEALCKHWIAFERHAVRRHLDQTYTEAIISRKLMPNGDSALSDDQSEVMAVQAELQELSREIDGLISLVAEHQYMGSIRKSLNQARHDAEAESAKWSEYTACVLLFLTARLEALHELHQHCHVYKAALKALEHELRIISVDHDDAEEANTSNMRDAHQNGRGLKPLRLVQATYNDPQETTTQILKLLNIKVKQPIDQISLARTLHEALQTKVREHGGSLQDFGQEQRQTLQRSLDGPSQHLQALLRSISSGSVPSMSPEKTLKRLESITDDLASRIHSLDIDQLSQSIAQSL